jgi:hypothetical protein
MLVEVVDSTSVQQKRSFYSDGKNMWIFSNVFGTAADSP